MFNLYKGSRTTFPLVTKVKSLISDLFSSNNKYESGGKLRTGGLNRNFPTVHLRRFMTEESSA